MKFSKVFNQGNLGSKITHLKFLFSGYTNILPLNTHENLLANESTFLLPKGVNLKMIEQINKNPCKYFAKYDGEVLKNFEILKMKLGKIDLIKYSTILNEIILDNFDLYDQIIKTKESNEMLVLVENLLNFYRIGENSGLIPILLDRIITNSSILISPDDSVNFLKKSIPYFNSKIIDLDKNGFEDEIDFFRDSYFRLDDFSLNLIKEAYLKFERLNKSQISSLKSLKHEIEFAYLLINIFQNNSYLNNFNNFEISVVNFLKVNLDNPGFLEKVPSLMNITFDRKLLNSKDCSIKLHSNIKVTLRNYLLFIIDRLFSISAKIYQTDEFLDKSE